MRRPPRPAAMLRITDTWSSWCSPIVRGILTMSVPSVADRTTTQCECARTWRGPMPADGVVIHRHLAGSPENPRGGQAYRCRNIGGTAGDNPLLHLPLDLYIYIFTIAHTRAYRD